MNFFHRILLLSALFALPTLLIQGAKAQNRFGGFQVNHPVFHPSTEKKSSDWGKTHPISKPIQSGKPSYAVTPKINIEPKPPVRTKPAPAAIDRSKMVSVLQGQSNKISSTSSVQVTQRKTTINPKAMPKGYQTFQMKQGRTPATGTPDKLANSGTKHLYMKKGKPGAEGVEEYHTTRIKDGRDGAKGHDHHGDPYNYDRPGTDHWSGIGNSHSAAPSEISYEVDTSSRLATNVVKFQKGNTNLADELSYHFLHTLAEALRSPELAGSQFVVEGHASADGSSTANLILSQQRANAIYDFLVSRGVAAHQLLAVGHGEAQARFQSYEPEYLLAQDRQVIVFKLAR